jgi:subtilisin family serine protease
MKHLIRLLTLSIIALFLTGCSGGQSPLVPSNDGFNNQTTPAAPAGNPFEGIPVDEPYDNYTVTGESFTIDTTGGFQRNASTSGTIAHNVIMNLDSVDLDKASATAAIAINLHNDGSIIYDAHLVLDEIAPAGSVPIDIDGTTLDGKPFWNFGIIPAGKTSPTRNLQIQFSSDVGISVAGHVEFKERAYIQWNDLILHTDGFNGDDIIDNPTYGQIVSNEIIAGIPESSNISEVYDYLVSENLMPVGYDSKLRSMELRILDGLEPEDVIWGLKSDAYLIEPEPNTIGKIDYFPNDPPYDPVQPDDHRWAFERIQAVEAWDYFSDGIVDESGDASVAFGTVFAIVDTGLSKHQDFELAGLDFYVIDNVGKNFITPWQSPEDDNGHGTKVAGIAGAMGNNAFGMAGMAWNPFFLPIKVLNAGGYSSGYSVELGLVYLANLAFEYHWTKVIVNMSLGGYSQNPPYWQQAAVTYLNTAQNTILCAAAGNDKNDSTFAGVPFSISANNHYPAAFNACVSVGASSRMQEGGLDVEVFEEDPEPWDWGTNWGHTVDLCAPGSLSIYTTDNTSTTAFTETFGGTSASTPFVSGTAALLWSKHPEYTKAQILDLMKSYCDPMETHGKQLGSGRLNTFEIFYGIDNLPETPTWITSNITEDTTWSPQGSPYVIDCNFSINTDVTLTILPGTVVKLNYNRGITVNGTLIANAEGHDTIYFTTIKDDLIDGVDVEEDGNQAMMLSA